MATKVNKVINNTDAELVVVDQVKKSAEEIPPHSEKALTDENLFDITFVSKTARPIYIRIKSIVGDGDVGDGDSPVVVEAGDPDEEEDLLTN